MMVAFYLQQPVFSTWFLVLGVFGLELYSGPEHGNAVKNGIC
jgi:hypothetical protein